jgi:uroporphyrin-III C-methyltransferase/precorrin-2 dehydrogenase/sirohydrochlorin ferrochelatase
VVQQGTTPDQRVVSGTLSNLPALVAEAGLHSPCLIIVGEVVRLRDQLAWFGEGAAADASAVLPLDAELNG